MLGSTSKPTPVIASADVAGSRSTSKIGMRSNSTLATPLTGQRGVLQRQGKIYPAGDSGSGPVAKLFLHNLNIIKSKVLMLVCTDLAKQWND